MPASCHFGLVIVAEIPCPQKEDKSLLGRYSEFLYCFSPLQCPSLCWSIFSLYLWHRGEKEIHFKDCYLGFRWILLCLSSRTVLTSLCHKLQLMDHHMHISSLPPLIVLFVCNYDASYRTLHRTMEKPHHLSCIFKHVCAHSRTL